MKKYLYCDSCFLITFYQDKKLGALSQYKNLFFISDTQIRRELFKPDDLTVLIRESITVILEDRIEIMQKTDEFIQQYETLSYFDCLCMAYALLDGYILITDDKALLKKCSIHGIETKTSKDIEDEYIK